MTAFRYLTDAEARTLTRSELLERIEAQQTYYDSKRRKTAADEAAMDELSRILHQYINIGAAFDSAFAALDGRKAGYWETRPADDQPVTTQYGDHR